MFDEKFEEDETVLVDYSQYGRLKFRKGKIVEITKAGNYKVLEDGKNAYMIFHSSGRLREKSIVWNTPYIKKFSQELWNRFLEQEEKRSIVHKISNTIFANWSIEDLREIEKIINKYQKGK